MSDIGIAEYDGVIIMIHPLIQPVYLDHGVPIKFAKFIDWSKAFEFRGETRFIQNRLWIGTR